MARGNAPAWCTPNAAAAAMSWLRWHGVRGLKVMSRQKQQRPLPILSHRPWCSTSRHQNVVGWLQKRRQRRQRRQRRAATDPLKRWPEMRWRPPSLTRAAAQRQAHVMQQPAAALLSLPGTSSLQGQLPAAASGGDDAQQDEEMWSARDSDHYQPWHNRQPGQRKEVAIQRRRPRCDAHGAQGSDSDGHELLPAKTGGGRTKKRLRVG